MTGIGPRKKVPVPACELLQFKQKMRVEMSCDVCQIQFQISNRIGRQYGSDPLIDPVMGRNRSRGIALHLT